MIRFIEKEFSSNSLLIKDVTGKLEKEKEYNYEVDSEVSKDFISINSDLSNIIVYLPRAYEFSQYNIDDFIREMLPYTNTDIRSLNNRLELRVYGKLTSIQYYKLVKFLIKEGDFCIILDN